MKMFDKKPKMKLTGHDPRARTERTRVVPIAGEVNWLLESGRRSKITLVGELSGLCKNTGLTTFHFNELTGQCFRMNPEFDGGVEFAHVDYRSAAESAWAKEIKGEDEGWAKYLKYGFYAVCVIAFVLILGFAMWRFT